MSLGDEVNELTAMDYLEAADFSEASQGGPNLLAAGFSAPLRWPEISRLEPDYLLVSPALQYALVVDVKSGHIQKDDPVQARAYRALPPYVVSDFCAKMFKALGLSSPNVRNFDVCFLYYQGMLEGANLLKYANQSDLDALVTEATILVTDPSLRRLTLWQGSARPLSNATLDGFLRAGIRIPKNPASKVRLTRHPSDEMIALVVAQAVLDRRGRQRSVSLSPQMIRDEILGSPRDVTLRKMESILVKLRRGGFCSIPRQQATGFQAEYAFDDVAGLIAGLINPMFAGKTLEELTRA